MYPRAVVQSRKQYSCGPETATKMIPAREPQTAKMIPARERQTPGFYTTFVVPSVECPVPMRPWGVWSLPFGSFHVVALTW